MGINTGVRYLKHWGALELGSLGMGGVAEPPHICYLAERRRSALKGAVIDEGGPQNWIALELPPFGTAWGRG